MDVESILYEVNNIDKELSFLRKKHIELNKRKKKILDQAIDILNEKGEKDIVYKGQKYYIEEKSKHARKNEKKKKEDAIRILNEEGFYGHDADNIYGKIHNVLKGQERVIRTLKK